MNKRARLISAFVCVLLSQACTAPNKREPIELLGPGGFVVTCFQPPADIATTTVKASVDAAIPKLVEALKANATVEQSFERIRSEIKDLQATEVLEFRLCVAYANRIMSSGEYKKFLAMLPGLKGESTATPIAIPIPSLPPATTTSIASYDDQFKTIRTNELELSRAGERAFDAGEYAWAAKFLEQARDVQASGVWQSNYAYLVGAYLGLSRRDDAAKAIEAMQEQIKTDISKNHGYLGWKTTLGFVIGNFGQVRNKLPAHTSMVDAAVESVIELRKKGRD